MNRFRSAVIAVLGGGLAGTFIAALIGGRAIPWYYQPGQGMAQCSCHDVSLGVAQDLIRWELIGLIAGAVLGLLVYVLFIRAFRKHPTQGAATPAQPPAAHSP